MLWQQDDEGWTRHRRTKRGMKVRRKGWMEGWREGWMEEGGDGGMDGGREEWREGEIVEEGEGGLFAWLRNTPDAIATSSYFLHPPRQSLQ